LTWGWITSLQGQGFIKENMLLAS